MKFGAYLVVLCFAVVWFQQSSCASINNPRNVQVDADVQMRIMEISHLKELIEMKNAGLVGLATNVFRRKYSRRTIVISDSYTDWMPIFKRDAVVMDIELAEAVLSNFGSLIDSVLINYSNINQTEWGNVLSFVSNNCAETLTRLQFYGFTANPLLELPQFFPNVEVVQIVGEADTIGNETATISTIFPSLKHLEVSVRNMKNQSWIESEYPNLEQLYTSLSGMSVQRFTEATIEEVLRKNPQLRTVGTGFASLAFLNVTNVLLPNLETIVIGQFPQVQNDAFPDQIAFVNVKKLIISSSNVPRQLQFPQLTEVQFNTIKPFNEDWVEFYGNFKTIKKLNAIVGGEIEYTDLYNLGQNLTSVAELSVVPSKNVTIDQLLEFVQSCEKLEKLLLVVSEPQLIEDFDAGDIFDEAFIVETKWDGSWGTILVDTQYRS